MRSWHRPGRFAVSLALLGLILFSTLGTWQVQRAGQKRTFLAAFEHAADAPAMSLPAARHAAADSSRYPHVRVRGRYGDASYLLDNQLHDGRSGVRLYRVFESDDASVLLVAMGFLTAPAGQPPQIPAPPAGTQELTALYAPAPGHVLRMGGNPLPGQRHWPKVTTYIDLGEISADAGEVLDQRVLLLDPQPGSAFVRDWQPAVLPVERHYGYAFTWFSFALLTLIIFVSRHWRKPAKSP